jgi:hypothetical protein
MALKFTPSLLTCHCISVAPVAAARNMMCWPALIEPMGASG